MSDSIEDRLSMINNRLKNIENDYKNGKVNHVDYLVQKEQLELERSELSKIHTAKQFFDCIPDKHLDKPKRDNIISDDDVLNLIIELENCKSIDELIGT